MLKVLSRKISSVGGFLLPEIWVSPHSGCVELMLSIFSLRKSHVSPLTFPYLCPGCSSGMCFLWGYAKLWRMFLNFFSTLFFLFSSAFRNVTSSAVLSAKLLSLNPTEFQRLQSKVTQSYLLSITGQKGLACLHSDTSLPKSVVQIISWLMLKGVNIQGVNYSRKYSDFRLEPVIFSSCFAIACST